MTDVAVDTLRLRGPSGRRLARIAATALPHALERALAGIGDIEIDSVTVNLDLDPEDYDDETLAVLWADAIRVRLLEAARAGGSRSPRADRQPDATAPQQSTPRYGADDLVAAVHAWLAAGDSESAVLPSPLLALGDAAVAAGVRARVSPEVWITLCERISRVLHRVPGVAQDIAASSGDRVAAPPAVDPESHATAPGAGTTDSPRVGDDRWPGRPVRPAPAVDVLADLAPLAADHGDGLDPAAVTRAAGLVLLYPWLTDHCRRAEALHPALDPLDVREAALALVVEPGDPGVANDPLVAFLAGRPVADVARRERVPLPRANEVAESAERVLMSFAAVIRGFERSSPRFLRDGWIVRLGVLDTDRDPALLTAATHPLDVVLPLLPYPVGLLKLPWSPPVTVRFR